MEEKRHKQDPVPSNLDQFLNQMQMMTLNKIENFGWHLWFVRRPLFHGMVFRP